jgi:hypothetical protein
MTYVVTAAGKPPLDLTKAGLCYLASPYTKYPHGLPQAVEDISRVGAHLLKGGIAFYCPVAHCFPLSEHGGINPCDHAIWLPFQRPMMDCCNVLIVAEMDGWSRSYGIAWETSRFVAQGKPVVYLDPERFILSLTPGACALPAEAPAEVNAL